ncbi:type IV pilin-like G/H family protein [Dulcicalothrix desertica]|nr:type IV pilin-like G/H family protein [Dulcicalothrix desertica]TWH40110.1 prepilin-type N-terminal cleavage/methylation domain-containing protein [Dulcicalothrix desertica PCC 7102]
MKTELKAKFIQHILNKKKEDEGFTLIELLVVIIIIGILSAIALPSFLNQANKAKQSESKTYVGSMNRAQQAQYMEGGAFADTANFGKLGLGVRTETQNYQYKAVLKGTTAVTNQAVLKVATAPLKAYIGGVQIATIGATSEATTLAILCEAKTAGAAGGKTGIEEATFGAANTATGPSCGGGDYVELK